MRWAVLATFSLLVATTQVVWLTYAPVASAIHGDLGVSEGAVGDLAVLFPLVYVLVSLPAGRLLDAALVPTLTTGAALTALGGIARAIDPTSYAWALAGQVVLAVAQPVVLNAITAVAARWFAPEQRVVAVSVASAGQFVGILVAAGTAQPLVDAGGLRALVVAHAGLAVLAGLALTATLRAKAPEAVPAVSARLRPDALLWTLAAVLFIGFGLFNALATWLDTLFAHLGHPGRGGLLTGVLTVAGVAGAAVIAPLVARTGRRRTSVAGIGAVTVAGIAGLAAGGGIVVASLLLAAVGFVLLAGLPIALDWAGLHVADALTARATAFLLLAGNLGGAVVVLVVQATLDSPRVAFALMALIAAPTIALARRLPPDRRPEGVAPTD